MDRPSLPSRHSSFDGPGSRPILLEPGSARPAVAPSQKSGSPTMQTPSQTKSASSHSISEETPSPDPEPSSTKRLGGKANVSAACGPCKKAHLACDVARPCKRCVNMGKEELCEDVPHKKRGRPKNQQQNLGPPYPTQPPIDNMQPGSWRGGSSYYQPHPLSPPRTANPEPEIPPAVFTLFTTTDLSILRATQESYNLTGWYSNEMINQNVREYVHPDDIHLLNEEVSRLINVEWLPRPLVSRRDVHSAIPHRSEFDLLSPAEGMGNTYPNQNMRIRHSNRTFSHFNVRLHIGGAFGASLWNPDTVGSVYLVVSFLPLAGIPRELPIEARRPAHHYPPKSVTLPPINHNQTLPPFSSVVTAPYASRPLMPLHDPRPNPYELPPPQTYYTSISSQPPSFGYPRGNIVPPRRRSPSPTHRNKSGPPYPEYPPSNVSAHAPPPHFSHQNHPSSYPPQPRYAPQSYPSTNQSGNPQRPPQSSGNEDPMRTSQGPPPSSDYTRRAWEL